MSAEVFRDNSHGLRPVDLSVFMRGSGYAAMDLDRHFSASVPPYVLSQEDVPLAPVVSVQEELRANPDRTSHPLAAQVALRLIVENGEL